MRLDVTSLLNISQSCKYFNELLLSSTKLIKKIKVVISFPERNDEDLSKFEHILKDLQLTRPYQNLEIIRLRDEYLSDDDGKRAHCFNLIGKLATSVKLLKVVNCHILRIDLVSLLLPFNHLQECCFKNLMLFDHVVTDDLLPNLTCLGIKKLELAECDFFCLLMFKEFIKLEHLEITSPAYNRTDVEFLEKFLMKQENLKELILHDFRFNSTYSTSCLANVPFQLENLSLHNVSWDIAKHCEVFLKSQRNLKKLKLSHFNMTSGADNHIWVLSVMHHLFTMNPKLKSLTIETSYASFNDFKDAEFLPDVVNNTVEELEYTKDQRDKSELMKIFTRIFPKVKKLSFTASCCDSSDMVPQIQQFKNLETLKLQICPKSFISFQLGTTTLNSFQYYATNEDKSFEKLTEFFQQNPKIKHLSLNIEPLTIEEITEMILPLAETLETITFSDLHLNTNEGELFLASFPSLRKIRSDLSLQPETVTILKNNNIVFEAAEAEFLLKREELTTNN